ncbi:MAG: DegT/DnrJ/EryC1/StrS family aminotransferase [Paracoccaceae bacterium]|nr:DegT/DnrJ/EryC1/StrS family aminotransferase [Paracoccaceae bacterium]
MRRFTGSFTQQEALPQEAIDAAVRVMESGRFHRYNLAPEETGEVAALEAEFRDWQGSAYCLAVTSGGQAMQIALRALGVGQGDAVLSNAFTLAPVPGAIAAVGARAVLVEVDESLRLDLNDLSAKIESSGARCLLLSHMRGHLCDLERVRELCRKAGITVVEDCAHTMGACWNGRRLGAFGDVACFSTQTYKHLNSGEGGFLTTDNEEIAARATLLSGSYMLYERHGAGPGPEVFEAPRDRTPNCSARMDALRAAILRPQLKRLDANIARWNALYRVVERGLSGHNRIALIDRPAEEFFVGSSIQFRLPHFNADQCLDLLSTAAERGVELKWFGREEAHGFTSSHRNWRFAGGQTLPQTDAILATVFDMRLPLTFSEDDCRLIAELIVEAVDEVMPRAAAPDRNARTSPAF